MKKTKKLRIGNRTVGEGEPCFIVLEAGPTIYDFESGKALCKAAADCGADAIKFQIMDVDRLMGDKSVDFTYGTAEGNVTERLYDILKRRELPVAQWKELKRYCDELGILFFSTAFFPEEVELLKEIGSCAIKIAAADINHPFLIGYAAKAGLPIILDARGTLEELERAVSICRGNGNDDIMIMHCPPGYPCKDEEINFSVLRYLKEKFGCPVGFSDHSVDALMDYACMGFGADCIEKTITLDKTTRSAEHYMSLEPHELKGFVENVRKIERAVGRPKDVFALRPGFAGRRSLVAFKDLKKGAVLKLEDLDFRRPGSGITADRYEEFLGKRLRTDVRKDNFLKEDMFG